MSSIDRAPSQLSATLSIAAGTVGTIAHGVPVGVGIGVIGLVVLAYGAVRGSRRAITRGALVVFGGVVYAGYAQATPEGLLVATAATVLAWDFGEHAINVGEQLGREATTARGELAHAASSALVGATATGISYLIFVVATGGQPLSALVLLLAAALTLAASLRD